MSVRRVSYGFLVLGGLSTLAFMVYAAQGFRLLASGFAVWALTPYAAFAIATRVARTRGSIIAASVTSLIAVFVGVFLYVDTLFVHFNATAALAFIFVSLYQLLAAVVVLVFALARRRHATQDL